MKTSVKNLCQEMIEYIEFPTLFYLYETGRIIALNKEAKDIVDIKNYNMNKLWATGQKLKLPSDLLENGSRIYYNQSILTRKEGTIEIDIEINSIVLDNQHLCLCLLEYSYKQCFVKHLRKKLPRVFWKDRKLQFLGCNMVASEDVDVSVKPSGNKLCEDFLDEDTSATITEEELELIHNKELQCNVLQEIRTEYNFGYFTSMNRMPLINKNGTVVGLVGIYSLIFNREEYKRLYDDTLRENNLLSNIIRKSESVVMSCKNDFSVEYISPNLSKFGYTVDQVYSGEIKISDVIYKQDMELLREVLGQFESGECTEKEIELRMYTASRLLIFIRLFVEAIKKGNSIVAFDCVFNDITDKKVLENQLRYTEESVKYYKRYETLYNKQKNQLQEKPFIPTFEENKGNKKKVQTGAKEKSLEYAILSDCKEFDVYYQPIVHSKTFEMIGVEALVRWKSERYGLLNANEFLSISEYLRLIGPLGKYVLKQSLSMFKELKEEYDVDIHIHINISVIQLVQIGFVEELIQQVMQDRVAPSSIVLEIKEGLVADDMKLMIQILTKLKEFGFLIAIDNFGIGYSSIKHLLQIPLDYIKIDKELLSGYKDNEFSPTLYAAILDIANSIHKKVIVEGVETKGQLEFLAMEEIEAYQGYYFGMPMTEKELVKQINKNKKVKLEK